MPNAFKKAKFSRASVLAVLLAFIFIIAYFLVLMNTYNRLFASGENEMLLATRNASKSLSKSIESDSAQMDAIVQTISSLIKNEGDFELTPEYLDSLSPVSCDNLVYYETDGTIVSSSSQNGSETSIDFINKLISNNSDTFTTDDDDNIGKDYAHYHRTVTIGNETVGYLLGTFNYDRVLNECYNTSNDNYEYVNMVIDDEGIVILNTVVEDSDFFSIDNLFTYIKENGYEGNYKDKNDTIIDSVGTFATDASKFAITISPVENFDNLNVVRIMPTPALFANVGNFIAFMVLASLLFFFIIAITSYRFYKSIVKTSNQIKDIAFTDPLTGFANFSKFKEDSEAMLKEEKDRTHFLCCIDMVGFRYINDAFGYDTGDEILIEISNEIDDLLFEDELFCRVTSDKFVALTERDFSDTDHNLFLYQLSDRISTIKPLAKSHIRLEVQMGVYKITSEDLEDLSINALYDRALIALNSIEHTDSAVALYDVSIYNEQLERKDIESRMHQALSDGEFRVYVQPKYRTSNAKLAAGEALIRWIDPEKGIVPPIKFIPLFEQNRFVHDVDLYVMEVIARFQRMRLNEGLPVVPISLNISPVEITMPGFRESYISIKDKYDIPAGLIELEFTEGIFFDNEKLFKDVITDFQSHGFTCSMDDFGSGYSSLNILKDLPVDTLKLDKLFFRESENTSRDRSIIRSVVAMARSLNIKTVAEGVETLDVVDFLKLIGCTLIQGYIYSKPLPLTEFEEKLDNENIDTDDEFELDFDKFEVVPLDMPLTNSIDDTLRRTYAAIVEINAGGNIYHMFYPGESDVLFDKIPERGFFASFTEDLLPKYVHPKDIDKAKQALNPMNLSNHFKANNDLDLEYRHMRKDGTYSWMKLHIIKASGGRSDSQIFFGYFNIIDDYKEAEESLSIVQSRFSAAYSNLNGVVFELDMSNGYIDILETHSRLLAAVKDVHNVEDLVKFVTVYLLHPDSIGIVSQYTDLEYIREHFITNNDKTPIFFEAMAKPSRKVSRYNYYAVTLSAQGDTEKILLTIEDISAKKTEEEAEASLHQVTDIAFANIYSRVYAVNLDKDLFSLAVYPEFGRHKPMISEGKYSLAYQTAINHQFKEEDKNTLSQILSLEGLENFYNDSTTNEFTINYQVKPTPESINYEWVEALIVSAPKAYGSDRKVLIFERNISNLRYAEQNLNEYAHRLSYSLAMFDYAYSVDCNTETVEIIGGLKFEPEVLDREDLTYSELTAIVKNGSIAEEDQALFRRFTYLDELMNYFAEHSATMTRIFKSIDNEDKIVEVSVIYGTREQKITIFVRQLDKRLFFENDN